MALNQGKYRAVIDGVQVGESTQQNPQIIFTVTLEAYVEGGREDRCDPLSRRVTRTITEKTLKYVLDDLRALGYDRDDLDGIDPAGPDPFPFAGTVVHVRMERKPSASDKNKDFEEWSFAFRDAKAIKPLEPSRMSKLNAAFAAAARAAGPAKPAAVVRRDPGASAPPGGAEEKIPF